MHIRLLRACTFLQALFEPACPWLGRRMACVWECVRLLLRSQITVHVYERHDCHELTIDLH